MKKVKIDTDLSNFFERSVDIQRRLLWIGSVENVHDSESGVDFLMAERAIKGLAVLDMAAPEGNQPITVLMNNPGGDIYHGMAIFDAIRSCKNEVHIIVYGMAMSMGGIILQAADRRIMAPNSRFMMHYGFAGIGEQHPKSTYKWADEYKKADEEMVDMFLARIREKHPKFTRSKLDQMLNFDTILNSYETVEHGLADEVLNVKKRVKK